MGAHEPPAGRGPGDAGNGLDARHQLGAGARGAGAGEGLGGPRARHPQPCFMPPGAGAGRGLVSAPCLGRPLRHSGRGHEGSRAGRRRFSFQGAGPQDRGHQIRQGQGTRGIHPRGPYGGDPAGPAAGRGVGHGPWGHAAGSAGRAAAGRTAVPASSAPIPLLPRSCPVDCCPGCVGLWHARPCQVPVHTAHDDSRRDATERSAHRGKAPPPSSFHSRCSNGAPGSALCIGAQGVEWDGSKLSSLASGRRRG